MPNRVFILQMVASFAEFERAMLKERTKIGLDAAREEGRIGGRKSKLKPQQQQEIVQLVKKGKKTAADAARLFGVHRATVTRLLQKKLAAQPCFLFHCSPNPCYCKVTSGTDSN